MQIQQPKIFPFLSFPFQISPNCLRWGLGGKNPQSWNILIFRGLSWRFVSKLPSILFKNYKKCHKPTQNLNTMGFFLFLIVKNFEKVVLDEPRMNFLPDFSEMSANRKIHSLPSSIQAPLTTQLKTRKIWVICSAGGCQCGCILVSCAGFLGSSPSAPT